MVTPALTNGGFEMLRAAVRVARDQQIRHVAGLRMILEALWEADISAALQTWANYERSKGA